MSEFENGNMPITYLVGVLLGVNAIKDSYLWVDSPDCFFFKNDYIQGNHDITSTLRREDGNHKILSTIADADNVVDNRNNKFVSTLKQMAEKDFVKQIFVSSMPMSQIIGTDYDGIIAEVKEEIDKPIFNIPSRSMTSCWIDGYADLLFSIAKNICIDGGKPKKENIAIVGNLFDRGEGDCIGNVNELKRIIEEGLGLKVVSIWLDGGNYEDILNIKDAGTIISLPYGRKAAKKIAKRLNADLLELDLPFGLDKTGDFINEIASNFGLEKKSEDFIKKELTKINKIDIIKWVIPHTFFGKNIAFYGDPYLLNGIIDLSNTLGFNLKKVFLHGEEKHLKNNKNIFLGGLEIKEEFNFMSENIDLFISNSNINNGGNNKYKKMEFGFPSYDYHVYTFDSYFGYSGALKFINRIANILNKK